MKLLSSENGFALPSMLFLVTILTLAALSIVFLQYLRRQEALFEVARVKAEYAAQSGIALVSSNGFEASGLWQGDPSQVHRETFADGSNSDIHLEAWGAYLWVRSVGSYHRVNTLRTALLGRRMSSLFEVGLVFGRATHQLILSGTSSIVGNVVVGPAGATTGSLPEYATPHQLPVIGNIIKEATPQIASPELGYVRALLDFSDGLLQRGISLSGADGTSMVMDFSASNPVHFAIPDSIRYLYLSGDISELPPTNRREAPLYVVVHGDQRLRYPLRLTGLLAIVSDGSLTVEEGAVLDNVLLISKKSVILKPSAKVRAQLIAPVVRLDSGAVASYPSVVLSIPWSGSPTSEQSILIQKDVHVEGAVCLITGAKASVSQAAFTIVAGAKILGLVYSDCPMTFDGSVTGMVMAEDFSFYQSPTTYVGWLRSGEIDRRSLPDQFLLPFVLNLSTPIEVVTWI